MESKFEIAYKNKIIIKYGKEIELITLIQPETLRTAEVDHADFGAACNKLILHSCPYKEVCYKIQKKFGLKAMSCVKCEIALKKIFNDNLIKNFFKKADEIEGISKLFNKKLLTRKKLKFHRTICYATAEKSKNKIIAIEWPINKNTTKRTFNEIISIENNNSSISRNAKKCFIFICVIDDQLVRFYFHMKSINEIKIFIKNNFKLINKIIGIYYFKTKNTLTKLSKDGKILKRKDSIPGVDFKAGEKRYILNYSLRGTEVSEFIGKMKKSNAIAIATFKSMAIVRGDLELLELTHNFKLKHIKVFLFDRNKSNLYTRGFYEKKEGPEIKRTTPLSTIKNIIFFPKKEEEEALHCLLNRNGLGIINTQSMEEAISCAYERMRKGEICLISSNSPNFGI